MPHTYRMNYLAAPILLLMLTACGDEPASTAPAAPSGEGAPAATVITPNPDLPPLEIEKTGDVNSLPAVWPRSWFLVHDMAFHHMLDGKVMILDVLAEGVAEQFKGMFNLSLVGNFTFSMKRGEIYGVETFYSRGTRGTRTDLLTIHDTTHLAPIAEVIWPQTNRFMGMPERYATVLINEERLLLAFNLNPATSVTVVNLDSREVVNEIAIPGCSLIYPTGQSGFSSLCANGGMLSTEISADGQVVAQQRIEPFFNSDTSPVFERPALINGIAYFPAFDGLMHPVDLTGNAARPGTPWQMVPESERNENWRPGGIALIDYDSLGRFYILMHPDGHDGTHNEGGPEVWVFDAEKQQRLKRIALKTWGLSVAASGGDKPLLLVSNAEMNLDLYDGLSGEHIRTITDFGQETPLMAHGIK